MSLNPEADPGYPIQACGLCGGGGMYSLCIYILKILYLKTKESIPFWGACPTSHEKSSKYIYLHGKSKMED